MAPARAMQKVIVTALSETGGSIWPAAHISALACGTVRMILVVRRPSGRGSRPTGFGESGDFSKCVSHPESAFPWRLSGIEKVHATRVGAMRKAS